MRLKLASVAVLALAAALSASDIAAAQDYMGTPECAPYFPHRVIYDASWWWRPDYPANWEPFFRRHVYRYGPLACGAPIATTPPTPVVVKSKY
jgi:hypothetical protein